MTPQLKWLGTVLQLMGSAIVAIHLSWSGWGFPVMLAGSIVWGTIAVAARDWPLAALQMQPVRSLQSLGLA